MARYQLRSGSAVLVDVPSSSNLDGSRKTNRRGTVFDTLGGIAIQYLESTIIGDEPIEWDIPRADGNQRGILQSASVGVYGDELILVSPTYGNISVAFEPGEEAYEEEDLPPDFGYRIGIRLRRLG